VRIAFLATSTLMGGAEVQVLTLAAQLRERGHEMNIISLIPAGPLDAEARKLGISTSSLGMRPGIPDPRGLLRLARELRAWRPDVLHSHMVHANLLARVVRPLTRIPVLICTVHSMDEGGALRMAAYRLTNRLADLTTIISHAAADRFVRIGAIPRDRLRVLPNGVDTTRFRPRPDLRAAVRRELGVGDKFLWLAVGRLDPAKDYPNLLSAFAQVVAHRPPTMLALVGGGGLQEAMERKAESLGVQALVRCLGLRMDVPELMSAADAYVMSSAWEGLPMVLLEAASSGLPIVATDVGGNKEIVVDGETGLLVPPRDATALASAMRRTMEMPRAELQAMGERGRAQVTGHYSLSRIVDTWEATYRELLGAHSVGRLASGGQRYT
jgi:glycosyltransferase involved in cell wall biosynthesis